MKVDCLDYRELPGQNPLWLDLLYNFERVAEFYAPVHRNIDDLQRRADRVLDNPPPFPRDVLAASLDDFNRSIGVGEAALRNISRLKDPSTLAVVTGQQVNLFGGPAYAVYKTATAVRLAQRLEEMGHNVVPIFWIASDDSDFDEIRSTTFFDREGGLFPISYPTQGNEDHFMVGGLALEQIEACLEQIRGNVYGGALEESLELLAAAYSPRHDFRKALAAWITSLFREAGLVVFDPLQSGFKKHLTGAFMAAVTERERILETLMSREAQLREKGFSPQFQHEASETFLFLIENGKRYKLEFQKDRFRAKHRRRYDFSRQELIDQIRTHPESIGSNVLLRPIIQDHLFPTVVYVGGPAEVAYFSQVNAISSFWGRETVVFPRVGVTLIDRKAQRLFKKYDLQLKDILNSEPQLVLERILKRGRGAEVLDRFSRLRKTLEIEISALRRDMTESDSPLADMMELAGRKMQYQLEKVRRRYVLNARQRDEVLDRHLHYLYSHLHPNRKLQERVINFNQFLAQEGPEFVEAVEKRIEPFCPAHQVLWL